MRNYYPLAQKKSKLSDYCKEFFNKHNNSAGGIKACTKYG